MMNMKHYFFISLFVIVFATTLSTHAFGAETYQTTLNDTQSIMIYDGQPILINANNIVKYQYPQHENSYASHMITFDSPVEGNLTIKIPRTLATFTEITAKDGEYFSDDLQSKLSVFALDGDIQLQAKYHETDCFTNYYTTLSNSTSVEFIMSYILTTEFEWRITEPLAYCSNVYESLRQFDGSTECGLSHMPQSNFRGEYACIIETSIPKLMSRGYLT